jgi:hypothetical protein
MLQKQENSKKKNGVLYVHPCHEMHKKSQSRQQENETAISFIPNRQFWSILFPWYDLDLDFNMAFTEVVSCVCAFSTRNFEDAKMKILSSK